jgi:hypothetical protein
LNPSGSSGMRAGSVNRHFKASSWSSPACGWL